MQTPIDALLVDAAERMESDTTLAPALTVISELADVDDSRLTLESCVEQLAMADGSVVDILIAEQTYRDWRADHPQLALGQAQTGPALERELRAAMEMLNQPSMESDMLQALKRTFGNMLTQARTFGKDLVDLRSSISQHKEAISNRPVLIDSVNAYHFLTRANKPVKNLGTCIDEDLKFVAACDTHYKHLFETSGDLGKRFREACNSDSNDAIRDAIDHFDGNLVDRSTFTNLTKFNLLGNRTVYLDKRGFPQFKKAPTVWKFSTKDKDEKNLATQLAKKQIHGFSIGGSVKSVKGVVGMNVVVAKKQVVAQVQATGGETDVAAFLKTLDKAIVLNNQVTKFAQMATSMGEKVNRLSSDMDDAYNKVSSDRSEADNVVRLRELRALHRSARRSVSQYMFLGKAIATMMEDHAAYVYRNITLIANDVLKKTVKDTEK